MSTLDRDQTQRQGSPAVPPQTVRYENREQSMF